MKLKMIVIVYIDDSIVPGKMNGVEELRNRMNNSFPVRILGELAHNNIVSRCRETGAVEC